MVRGTDEPQLRRAKLLLPGLLVLELRIEPITLSKHLQIRLPILELLPGSLEVEEGSLEEVDYLVEEEEEGFLEEGCYLVEEDEEGFLEEGCSLMEEEEGCYLVELGLGYQ